MRKQLIGVVTRDKNSKTRRVDVERRFKHRKYKKIVRGRTTCFVHDENNESHLGDVVEIAECRPRSALKRWELVRIVKAADPASLAEVKETIVERSSQQQDVEEAAPEPAGTEEE